MRWNAIVCFLFVGCHRSSTEPPTKSDAYCRANGAFQILPLGTDTGSTVRPAHTFSIVARDPETGDLGVAVQSHWFAVGANVAWVEAGVGAVATQSFIDPSYGKRGLDLLRTGKSPSEALRGLLQADEHCGGRQVGMIDNEGRTATWTGS